MEEKEKCLKSCEFRAKYNLDQVRTFDRTLFVEDMLIEFKLIIDGYKYSRHPVKAFDNAVGDVFEKWNQIFDGTKVELYDQEKFWKYFYATRIVAIRDKVYPDWKSTLLNFRLREDRLKYFVDDDQIAMDQEAVQNERVRMFNIVEAEFKRLFFGEHPFEKALNVLGIEDDVWENTKLVNRQSCIWKSFEPMSVVKHPDSDTGHAVDYLRICLARDYLLDVVSDELDCALDVAMCHGEEKVRVAV